MNADVEALLTRGFVVRPTGRVNALLSQAVWHASQTEAGRLFAIRQTMDPMVLHLETWTCELTKHFVVQIYGGYPATHKRFKSESRTYGAVLCRSTP